MLKKYLAITILIACLIIVILTNISPSHFLIGWDNLLQEFNLWHNIKRSIFSVWQERGFGFLVGHGEAAELPRELFILPLTFILPLNLVRQIYTFLMLATGVIGTYFLIKNLVSYKAYFLNQIIPLTGALFYLFNLAAIQNFYAPLEPFAAHYAFLPWLILSALYFIAHRNFKALVFFFLVNFLAIPQGQVPTIFIVYFLSLSFFLFVLILETKRKEIIFSSIKIIVFTLIINSFWLLPFIYFTLTNSQVAFNAKMNQMSTQTVFLQNKEFGNIWDVMLLKGFWFNNVDPNLQGNFDYMFESWRNHLTWLTSAIGYLFFSIILLGFVYVKRKKAFVLPFSSLFLLAFIMLTTNTPPFSWINSILREIPLFNQVFRFPFTKFSVLAALTYAFFFAIGVGKIISTVEEWTKNKKIAYYIFPIFPILILIFIFPFFRGDLFYNKVKIPVPKEYFELFKFFKSQPLNTKIADYPQHAFWGWSYYNWGYGGSGFLWYGMPQPILDRAFDVWSKNNENYYWEASYALYSKNPKLFENVLNKYQINYLLVDKNVINPSSPKALFTKELKDLLFQIPSVQEQVSFGNLDLYKVSLRTNVNDFVFISNKTSKINSYNWNNYDKAYSFVPNYISSSDNWDYFYPFRSLFSGKNEKNKEFTLRETSDSLEFSKTLPDLNNFTLNVPSILESEASFVADFKAKKNSDESIDISVELRTPEIYIGDKKVWGQTVERQLFVIQKGSPRVFTLGINGVTLNVDLSNFKQNIGSTYVSPGDNFLTLDNGSLFQTTISSADLASLLNQPINVNLEDIKNKEMKVIIPKVNDSRQNFLITVSKALEKKVKNCENFRKGTVSTVIFNNQLELASENATACISFYSSTLPHNQGYAIFVENQNIKGRPLHFWVLNEDEKNPPIDTYLNENKNSSTSSFVIPSYEQFGIGYSFNFDNIAIAEKTVNRLGNVSIYPIPYNFLTSIVLSDQNNQIASETYSKPQVNHPNESLYVINYPNIKRETMLILSQSYDTGWNAYEVSGDNFLTRTFPFIFGSKIKEHNLVNNWENGFILNNTTSGVSNKYIIIVYLPQYLEYLGFVILIISTIYIIKKRRLD